MSIYNILLGLHFLLTIVLIIIILIQTGKGADIGAVFGGGGAVFGSVGTTTLLNKLTIGLAAAFMGTSLILAIIGPKQQETIFKPIAETAAPVAAPVKATVPENPGSATTGEVNKTAAAEETAPPASTEKAETAPSAAPAPSEAASK